MNSFAGRISWSGWQGSPGVIPSRGTGHVCSNRISQIVTVYASEEKETEPKVAFVGDLVFNGMHSYMADDAILAWLVNLERAGILLADVPTIYPGHGQPGPLTLLEAQKAYLLAYCVAVWELADGKPTLTEAARQELVARMERFLPGAPLTFLITHSADAVAAELARSR